MSRSEQSPSQFLPRCDWCECPRPNLIRAEPADGLIVAFCSLNCWFDFVATVEGAEVTQHAA